MRLCYFPYPPLTSPLPPPPFPQAYPYYGSATRKLFAAEPSFNYQSGRRLQEAASFVRPLFGNSFVAGAAAADVPVPHFLTRKLTSYGPYYTARRLQTTGGRQLSYYYGQ